MWRSSMLTTDGRKGPWMCASMRFFRWLRRPPFRGGLVKCRWNSTNVVCSTVSARTARRRQIDKDSCLARAWFRGTFSRALGSSMSKCGSMRTPSGGHAFGTPVQATPRSSRLAWCIDVPRTVCLGGRTSERNSFLSCAADRQHR